MRTSASLFGYAIHPMLVVIALGALPTALVFDVLYVVGADAAWFRAGFVATLVGAAALALGMVPGFIDYLSDVPRRGEVWKHAHVHMLMGVALVGYFAASAAGRAAVLAEPSPAAGWSALVFSAAGLIGLVVQATTGRGLVLRHFLGTDAGATRVDEAAAEEPPQAKEART